MLDGTIGSDVPELLEDLEYGVVSEAMGQRLLRALLIGTALVVVACAPGPAQSSGPGWQLVRVADGPYPYLRVEFAGDDQLLVSFAVHSGCDARNEGMPSIAGFDSRGDTLVAVIARTPISPTIPCLTFKGRTFDVLLDVEAIPPGVNRIILGGEACAPEQDLCNDLSAEIPSSSLVTPTTSRAIA